MDSGQIVHIRGLFLLYTLCRLSDRETQVVSRYEPLSNAVSYQIFHSLLIEDLFVTLLQIHCCLTVNGRISKTGERLAR